MFSFIQFCNQHSTYAGSWPFGWQYHSLVNRSICFFAKSGSIIASGMQWNAESQAAKKGYSHESGMDRISSICKCFHCEFLIAFLSGGGGG